MKIAFVDANIFLRFITKDDEKKAARCYRLFERADKGELKLTTSESVLSEVVYILSSKKLYNLKRQKIKELLEPIINLQGLKIGFKQDFLEALRIFSQSPLDFEDALSVAFLKRKKIAKIYSYDRDFDKFKGIKRVEP